MKIEGSHTFEASREEVWRALLDPKVISRTLPGCDELQKVGENQYKGTLRVGVGSIQGQFDGSVSLSDLNPLESYHIKLKGKGAPGFLEGEGKIWLEEQGLSTILHYDITAFVGGRVASVGQRLLESTARVITRQALKRFQQEIKKGAMKI
ncbi:MAG: SRPBCC family protein [Acidobacteriota bacterium]